MTIPSGWEEVEETRGPVAAYEDESNSDRAPIDSTTSSHTGAWDPNNELDEADRPICMEH